MPFEGGRRTIPLTPRDKHVLAAVAGLAALGLGGGIYAAVDRGDASADRGCVTVVIPTTVGGSTIRKCGASAARFCRAEAPGDPRIADACRREGY
jgi:hypothetical protein